MFLRRPTAQYGTAEVKEVNRLSRRYAVWVVRLRWVVATFVCAIAVLTTLHLPGLQSDTGLEVTRSDSPAVQAEQRVLEKFGLPLLSLAALVQHDPSGLQASVLEGSLRQAAQTNYDTVRDGMPTHGIAGALPVPNSIPLPDRATTIVTYLWGGSALNGGQLVNAARHYGDRLGPGAHVEGVAGVVPVQVEQGRVVKANLGWAEMATLLVIALILALAFRSVVAPLIVLATAVAAYLITIRIIGGAAAELGISAPSQLEPLVVALTLGITTDYAIFLLSGMRYRVDRGEPPRDGLVSAVTHNLPIVLIAGLIVTAGVAAISVARLPLFRAFGPGLAIMVLVALAVSITLVPALLAIFGRFALWPGVRRTQLRDVNDTDPRRGGWFARWLTNRCGAALVVALSLAALVAASVPLSEFRASVASSETLPVGNSVRRAADAAADGFPAGVLAPTEILLERSGVTSERGKLFRLQRRIAAQPGVAAVLGPQQQPVDVSVSGRGLFLAPSGDAARYLIVFAHKPLAAHGLHDFSALRNAMPILLDEAGLGDAKVDYLGAGALAAELVTTARNDVVRVGVAVGLVNLVLLMIFLRAVVAPLYLLACSFLSVGAALGLTTLIFQRGLGYDGLIFYAPFAAAVLLVSLGSDYNVFIVGRIWDEARLLPLRDAVAVGLPRTVRPVTIAGVTLAMSFAFVGLIPVAPFQELAFAVAVGVLVDTFVVRSMLVPALIVLIGRFSGWPGHRLAVAVPRGRRDYNVAL